MTESWDRTLIRSKKAQGLEVSLPRAISRPLTERGYNAVRITVTDDGILLRPFTRDVAEPVRQPDIALPEWDTRKEGTPHG